MSIRRLCIESLELRRLLAADLQVEVTTELSPSSQRYSVRVDVDNVGDATASQTSIELPLLEDVQPYRVWQPEQMPDANGVTFFELFMSNITSAGDINADGFDDFVLGIGGNIAVVFGSDNLSPFELFEADGTNGFYILESEQQFLGKFMSSAGDFNGDGFGDFMFSNEIQQVYIVFGGEHIGGDGQVYLEDLDTLKFEPRYGIPSMDWVGDFDGDGIDDVVFNSGSSRGGEAYVLFGSEDYVGGEVIDGFDIGSDSRGLLMPTLGGSAYGVGDVNGDGLADIAVTGRTPENSDSKTRVVFGSSDQFGTFSLNEIDGSNGFAISPAGSPSKVADADGDGESDMLFRIAGSVHLLTDLDSGGASIDLQGMEPLQGASTVGEYAPRVAGDVNADGFDDFVSTTGLIYGAANIQSHDGAVWIGRANTAMERLYFTGVSDALGDVNGDGLSDFGLIFEDNDAPGEVVAVGGAMIVFGMPSTLGTGNIVEIVDIPAGKQVSYEFTGFLSEEVPYISATATASTEGSSASASIVIGEPPQLMGDVNLDGQVDFADFLILSSNFGVASNATPAMGDLNQDEKIDFADFLILSDNFGNHLAAVEEVFRESTR